MPDLGKTQAAEPRDWPRLSVVVPACNEAEELASAVGTLLAQDYPDLEIVLVDDRSTDETGRIVDRLAARDGRVKAIHVTELPEGWLGKVHAMHRGYQAATGQFVLLTDADVHFAPDALRKAVAYLEAHELDHLTALPLVLPTTLVLDSVIGLTLRHVLSAVRPWSLGKEKSRAFFGVGAFNLVRRCALDRTEGLEWFKFDAADDAALGLLMKRSGARCAIVGATDEIRLYWHRSLADAARGAEKGFVSVGAGSFPATVLVGLAMLAVEWAPALALVPLAFPATRPIGYAGLLILSAFLLTTVLLSQAARWRLLPILLTPILAPVTVALVWRAGYLGWRRGGAMWRGRLYRTEDLRRGARVRLP
jgi:cellulose synthase/poly-beta-1,6-N-acetylglucosamine synthase-like glycosyltransferase